MDVIFDDSDVRRVLANLSDELRGSPKTWGVVSRVLEQLVRNTFRGESDPWGKPWPPHSPVTLEARRREGQASLQRLIDSGALYESIRRDSGIGSAEVSAGAGLEYAEPQQFGNPDNLAWGGPSAPIPARPFFPLRSPSDDEPDMPDDWLVAILEPLQAGLAEAVK